MLDQGHGAGPTPKLRTLLAAVALLASIPIVMVIGSAAHAAGLDGLFVRGMAQPISLSDHRGPAPFGVMFVTVRPAGNVPRSQLAIAGSAWSTFPVAGAH